MNYSFKKVFVAACFGMLSFGMVMITIGSLLPELMNKFEMGSIAAGVLTSLLPVGILSGSLLFGPIADRYGYKWLMIISALLEAIGVIGVGLGEKIIVVQFSVFLIGFGGGVINGAANSLVADISEKNKGANLSLLGVFYGVGALGMPFLLAVLSGVFNFSTILLSVGVFIFCIVLFYLSISFPVSKQPQGFPLKDGLKIVRNPILLFCGLSAFFASSVEGVMNNWLTSFFSINNMGTKSEGLYFLTFMVLALTVMRVVLGGLLKKFNPFSVMIFLTVFLLIGFGFLFTGLKMYTLIGVIFIGIGTAANFPVLLGYIAELFPKLSATAFSVVFTMALTGNTISNYGMGHISEIWSVKALPIFGSILSLLMIGMMFMFKSSAFKKKG